VDRLLIVLQGVRNATKTLVPTSRGSIGVSYHLRRTASSRCRAGRPNAYGTRTVRRTVAPDESYVTVADVYPGGDSLLHISGWPGVEKVLQAIEIVEALGIDPAAAAPDYWRHVHNRLSAGDRPQSYTRTCHHAWLRRMRVMR
jgi:hypothetical protein